MIPELHQDSPWANLPKGKFFRESSFSCVDCGVSTRAIGHYYMVMPKVWYETGLCNRKGMLCLWCLERCLGRPLTVQDFTDCPLNIFDFLPKALNSDGSIKIDQNLRTS